MLVRAIAVCLVAASVLCMTAAHAEFHTWVDDAGQRRISNLPPDAIEPAGGIARGAHPYSIERQHDRLRNELARRDAESAAAAEAYGVGAKPGGESLPMSIEALRGLLVPGGEHPGR